MQNLTVTELHTAQNLVAVIELHAKKRLQQCLCTQLQGAIVDTQTGVDAATSGHERAGAQASASTIVGENARAGGRVGVSRIPSLKNCCPFYRLRSSALYNILALYCHL